MTAFWTQGRQRRVGLAILFALLTALVVVLLSDINRSSMIKSGDFPGFYVLAEILERGDGERLYDPELQRTIENELWPAFQGSFYMSVYPPYLAALLRPLAWFSTGGAQVLWTSVMVLAFTLALFLVRDTTSSLNLVFCTALSLCFAPVTAGILGGQNTAISMLIVAASIRLLERSDTIGDLLAGIVLGTWLCKPQYGVFALLGFGILYRRYRTFASSCVVAGIFYFLAAGLQGLSWPLTWLTAATRFGDQNFISNSPEMVSILGFCKGVALTAGVNPGTFAFQLASLVGGLCAAALVVDVVLVMHRLSSRAALKVREFAALFVTALPLLSPQTLFYDLGISVVGILAVGIPKGDKEIARALCVVVLALIAFFLRFETPLAPFFPFAVAGYFLIRMRLLGRQPFSSSC